MRANSRPPSKLISGHHSVHPRRDSTLRKNGPLYGPERFTYLPESNSYRCPAGQQLNYVGLNVRNRTHAYIATMSMNYFAEENAELKLC